MYPQPLLGILSDQLFNLGCICGGRSGNIALSVACVGRLDHLAVHKSIILLLTVPNTKCRKDICSGAYRHKCRATDSTSGNAKEWYKHTFFRMRVYIRQSSKDPAFTQDLHRCHRRICFVYLPVSDSRPNAQRNFFDHQIVERPREIADRLVYRGKTKNEHLPIAEMA